MNRQDRLEKLKKNPAIEIIDTSKSPGLLEAVTGHRSLKSEIRRLIENTQNRR